MKPFKHFIITLFFAGLLNGNLWSLTLEETYKKIIPVDQHQLLSIENQNGNIDITVWGRNEVEIIAYKKIHGGSNRSAQERMEDLTIEIVDKGDEIIVETRIPKDKKKDKGILSWLLSMGNNGASVNYEVRVPSKFNLNVNSTNGSIYLEQCEGRFRLETTNGKIKAEDIKGLVRCQTTNGDIYMTFLEVFPDDEMSFYSTNGSVRLYFPVSLNASLKANTTNGKINCDLPMQEMNMKSRNRLEAAINDGGSVIYVKTTNGNIRIAES